MLKLIIVAGMAFLFTIMLNFDSTDFGDERKLYYYPIKEMKHFTLGYGETYSDLLWLNILQNSTTCEMNLAPKGDTANLDLPKRERPANCDKGYVYRLLDFATDLSPRFDAPFTYGGLMLSVLIDDRAGAALIFDKAVEREPNNWELRYQAGYHYMYEMGDDLRAAKEFEAAARLGAPKWVYALAARLYTKSGQALISKTILENMLKNTPENFKGRERLENRLKEANEQLAKESLKNQIDK